MKCCWLEIYCNWKIWISFWFGTYLLSNHRSRRWLIFFIFICCLWLIFNFFLCFAVKNNLMDVSRFKMFVPHVWNVINFFYIESISFLWFMLIYWHACVSCICGLCSFLWFYFNSLSNFIFNILFQIAYSL
jgi:hypothetical protein